MSIVIVILCYQQYFHLSLHHHFYHYRFTIHSLLPPTSPTQMLSMCDHLIGTGARIVC